MKKKEGISLALPRIYLLSTYNKADEHEVVYYQSCGNQETMSCVENMVFEYFKNTKKR